MSNPLPSFSVVIPTYNRPERLQSCLEALEQLEYPRDRFEVIAVDDGSQVSLEPVLGQFAKTLPLRVLRQENAGPASARNAGAALAVGEYLAFTDDDCRPEPDWLQALAAVVAENPNSLIGGRTENALPRNPYSSASQLLVDYLYEYYERSRGEIDFFTSNNFAMPRERFLALGGFDASFPLAAGEDREFCDRWRHANFPVHHTPLVRLHHAHELSLTSFWRQHFNYGRGAFHFRQVRRQRTAQPIEIEPLAFYVRLLAYPLTRDTNPLSVLHCGLLFISQVANVAGYFWQRQHTVAARQSEPRTADLSERSAQSPE